MSDDNYYEIREALKTAIPAGADRLLCLGILETIVRFGRTQDGMSEQQLGKQCGIGDADLTRCLGILRAYGLVDSLHGGGYVKLSSQTNEIICEAGGW